MFKIMDFDDQIGWMQETMNWACSYIIVILGVKKGYKMLDDHFERIYGDVDVYLNGHN